MNIKLPWGHVSVIIIERIVLGRDRNKNIIEFNLTLTVWRLHGTDTDPIVKSWLNFTWNKEQQKRIYNPSSIYGVALYENN